LFCLAEQLLASEELLCLIELVRITIAEDWFALLLYHLDMFRNTIVDFCGMPTEDKTDTRIENILICEMICFSPFLLHYNYHHFYTPALLFEPTWIIPLNSVYLCGQHARYLKQSD
jgi:hypothetical protein